MSVVVKICGITNAADGIAAAEAGADVLGFVFYEASPRFIRLDAAAAIIRQLPPFIVKAGVFVDAPSDLVVRAIGDCGLNLLQFHGNELPEYCTQFGLMSLKAFRVKDATSLELLPPDRFPHVHALPDVDDPEEAWAFSVETLVAGLHTQVRRARRR